MNRYIGRRALSSGGGTLLKRERTAVKKHTESFEVSQNVFFFAHLSCFHFDSKIFFQSHLNSATTKHRIQDNHQGRSVPQDAVESGKFIQHTFLSFI